MNMRLSAMKRFEVETFINSKLKILDDGCVVYADAWADAAIAKRFDVTPSVIANIRLRTFGKLAVRESAHLPTLTLLADLEERVVRLEEVLGGSRTSRAMTDGNQAESEVISIDLAVAEDVDLTWSAEQREQR